MCPVSLETSIEEWFRFSSRLETGETPHILSVCMPNFSLFGRLGAEMLVMILLSQEGLNELSVLEAYHSRVTSGASWWPCFLSGDF